MYAAKMGWGAVSIGLILIMIWSLRHHPSWFLRYITGWFQVVSLLFIVTVPRPNYNWMCWYLFRVVRLFSFYTLAAFVFWVFVMLCEHISVLLLYTNTYYIPVIFILHVTNTCCLLTFYNQDILAPPQHEKPLFVRKYMSVTRTPVLVILGVTSIYFLLVTSINQWSDWYGLNLWEVAFILENSLVVSHVIDDFLLRYNQETNTLGPVAYQMTSQDESDTDDVVGGDVRFDVQYPPTVSDSTPIQLMENVV
jgi:hypothetical protein